MCFCCNRVIKSGWAGPTLQTYWCPHPLRMPSVKRDNANNWPIGVCRSEICHQAEISREPLLHCWPCVPRYCYIGDNPDISQLSYDIVMTADTMTPNRHQAIYISHAHSIMNLLSHNLYYVSHKLRHNLQLLTVTTLLVSTWCLFRLQRLTAITA